MTCFVCNDWAYLRIKDTDDWMECPNGEPGWSSNHPDWTQATEHTWTTKGETI